MSLFIIKSPEEVVQYLNKLFDPLIDIVNAHNGIINKFLCDGFMAVFDAPLTTANDVQSAVQAGLAIIEQVKALSDSGAIVPTTISIGLHLGEVVTGNVGSEQRKEYTVVGDTVNLAARIEHLNKRYQSQLLVSESVWEAVADARFDWELLEAVRVRGRVEEIRIYKLA